MPSAIGNFDWGGVPGVTPLNGKPTAVMGDYYHRTYGGDRARWDEPGLDKSAYIRELEQAKKAKAVADKAASEKAAYEGELGTLRQHLGDVSRGNFAAPEGLNAQERSYYRELGGDPQKWGSLGGNYGDYIKERGTLRQALEENAGGDFGASAGDAFASDTSGLNAQERRYFRQFGGDAKKWSAPGTDYNSYVRELSPLRQALNRNTSNSGTGNWSFAL